jgi:hypothetical protein
VVPVPHVKYIVTVATSPSDVSTVPSAALRWEFLLTLVLHRNVYGPLLLHMQASDTGMVLLSLHTAVYLLRKQLCLDWKVLYFRFFFYWRAPQQIRRTHRSLEAYCATLWWRWLVLFCRFFRVMEHRWNEIDRGKPKYSGKNLSQCPFVHYKSHMDWIQPGSPQWEAGD